MAQGTITKKQYNAMTLPEKLKYYNKQVIDWNMFSCIIAEAIVYKDELYHVKDEYNNGELVCYKLSDNGWNDKNKTYYMGRKDVTLTENISHWLA